MGKTGNFAYSRDNMKQHSNFKPKDRFMIVTPEGQVLSKYRNYQTALRFVEIKKLNKSDKLEVKKI